MSDPLPPLAELRRAAEVFNGFANADTSWLRLMEETQSAIDLSQPAHRTILLRWLNSWGCRIRYPREGEPAPFDEGVLAWWETWGATLPTVALADLTDAGIDTAAKAYADLAGVVVSAGRIRRTLGPTAAAKALYALRPNTIMPWDAAIAAALHGARDGAAFGRHLRLGRAWAATVIAEAGDDGAGIPALMGRPVSLAKILDEYLYVAFTMGAKGDWGTERGEWWKNGNRG
ncbi:hypothetical protein [Amycolatopsis keratiniphila]|uniref:hypothetical protein n=1 Tax=Amycolatopsis keratiniphila TaxID=129921 RepID=UPI000879A935|nr:hypothetical protein [Amycolatopsis keratiniphila]OLZ58332.1 hypothetical protein BS330_12195 [Amycolatopsis keratiniphila subsp. nogabecina]SDU28407.1 hypothetical protein SAMN04489733_2700 [Amycolatopsis keratiniphila]